jgi:hypothetical protein
MGFAKKKEEKMHMAAVGWLGPRQEEHKKRIDRTLKMMLERTDINVKAQNVKGNTALMEAVIKGNAKTFAAIASREQCKFDRINVEGKIVIALPGCRVPEWADRGAIIQAIGAAMDAEPKTEVAWPESLTLGWGTAGGSFRRFRKKQ